MSRTKVFKNIGLSTVTVADGATHSTVTLQVRGTENIELVLDDRDEVAREADGDDMGVIYKPGESPQFSGFVGEIRVKRLSESSSKTATVVVIRT